MKSSGLVIINLIIVFLLGTHNNVFSQQLTDELKARLPRTDRYKLTKAMTFITQGYAHISKAKELSSTSTESPKEKNKIEDAYYTNRIKASYCFRSANGLIYDVLNRSIKDFWKEFKGDRKALEHVVKIENAVYDSLIVADNLRENAENAVSIDDKISFVSKAELMENEALLRMKKVLYTYINWPEQADLAWLLSKDQHIPSLQTRISIVKSGTNIVNPTGSNKDLLLSISENQPGNFDEFSSKTMPGKILNNIDFTGLNDIVIDSVHKKWHKEAKLVNINADTSKKIVFRRNISPKNYNTFKKNYKPVKPSTGTFYTVQIVACRAQMSEKSLKRIYPGPEKISESYENNWFKYTVGKFNTYGEANDFKQILNIDKAFIAFYQNGIRTKPEFVKSR